MRAAGVALLLAVGVVVQAGAQIPSEYANRFRTDFAVPDGPAFVLLDVDQSTILRPTTVREVALSAADFVGSGTSITLPQAYALEFSPGLLIGGGSLTKTRYQQKPWLYRLQLSAATRRLEGQTSATGIAFGIRETIIDKADLRTNAEGRALQAFINSLAREVLTSVEGLEDRLRDLCGDLDCGDPETASEIVLALEQNANQSDPTQRRPPASILRESGVPENVIAIFLAQFTNSPAAGQASELLRAKIDSLQNELWNAELFQIAAALRAQGADSTGRNLALTRWSIWATYANGVGDWGQLLVGGRAGSARDNAGEDYRGDGSLSARFYAGTNTLKAFAEAQGTFRSGGQPVWLLNGGGEVRITKGWWVNFAAGIESDETINESQLRTSFALKLGLPTSATLE